MAEEKDKGFRIIVIVLLVINTFFLGSMWCSVMKCGPDGLSGKGKSFCPFTGKTYENGKGSSTDHKGSNLDIDNQ